jgi:hypothetical protein
MRDNTKWWKYQGDSRYEKVYEKMQFLGIQDITTNRQHKNGTIVWKLPIKNEWGGKPIEVASFESGYVRNQNSGYSNYQLNKTKKNFEKEWPSGYKYYSTERILIPIEIDRLEYLISYCLKNYYIKRANQVVDGDYVPKWKYENRIAEAELESNYTPEVKVIVNGHRYNVI